jgi:hypothetical protein
LRSNGPTFVRPKYFTLPSGWGISVIACYGTLAASLTRAVSASSGQISAGGRS